MTMKAKLFLVVVCLVSATGFSIAQPSGKPHLRRPVPGGFPQQPTTVQVWHEIDRRTSGCDESSYKIAFCARGGSLVGHAFVAWMVNDAKTRQCRIPVSFGFYPQGDAKDKVIDKATSSLVDAVFGNVPGVIANEANNPKSRLLTHCLIVEVDEVAFSASQRVIEKWRTKDYNLFHNNCINFLMDVARAANITVPPRENPAELPSAYLTRLVAANASGR